MIQHTRKYPAGLGLQGIFLPVGGQHRRPENDDDDAAP